MKIEAVLFDMDGLMVDTEPHYHQVQSLLIQKYGGHDPGPSLAEKMMGQKPLDSLRIFAAETGIKRDPALLLEERSGLLREIFRDSLRPMPGLLYLLTLLKQENILTGVVTGNSRDFLDLTLDTLQLHEYFTTLTSSDEVSRGKPAPDLYVLACKKLNISPSSAIVLEDSSNGIRAAKGAGCVGVAIPNGVTVHQDFTMADYRCENLAAAQWIVLPGR